MSLSGLLIKCLHHFGQLFVTVLVFKSNLHPLPFADTEKVAAFSPADLQLIFGQVAAAILDLKFGY